MDVLMNDPAAREQFVAEVVAGSAIIRDNEGNFLRPDGTQRRVDDLLDLL